MAHNKHPSRRTNTALHHDQLPLPAHWPLLSMLSATNGSAKAAAALRMVVRVLSTMEVAVERGTGEAASDVAQCPIVSEVSFYVCINPTIITTLIFLPSPPCPLLPPITTRPVYPLTHHPPLTTDFQSFLFNLSPLTSH